VPTTEVIPTEAGLDALALIVPGGGRRAAGRLRDHLTSTGRQPPDALRVIRTPSGRITAAAVAICMPGRTATLLSSPPHRTNESVQVARSLIEAAPEWDIDLLQAITAPDDDAMRAMFIAAGMQALADLHTMTAPLNRMRTIALPEDATLTPTDDGSLRLVLEQTYQHTLDCPLLRGLRKTGDIIAGHRAGGVVEDDLWVTINVDGHPAGCGLVTCNDQRMADLAYLGLAPHARGCGLGGAVLSELGARARMHGMRTMRLAVDARNAPAIRIYRRAGFRTRAVQRAVIHSPRGLQAAPT